jgi:hypothetical protein
MDGLIRNCVPVSLRKFRRMVNAYVSLENMLILGEWTMRVSC